MEHKSAKSHPKCDQDNNESSDFSFQREKQLDSVQIGDNGNNDEGEVFANTEEELKSDATVSKDKDTVKKGREKSSNSAGILSSLRARFGSPTEDKEEKKKKKERKKSDDKRDSLDSKSKFYAGDETGKCEVNSSTFYIASDPDEIDKDTALNAKDKDKKQEKVNVDYEAHKNNTDQDQGKYKNKLAEVCSEQAEEDS